MDDMTEIKRNAYKDELTKLYIEKTDERSVNSSIRQDDFEVYLRQKTYNNKITRQANKLIGQLKWLPYLKRLDIWKESREIMYEYRQNAINERQTILSHI